VARAAVDTVEGAVAAVICVVHENAPPRSPARTRRHDCWTRSSSPAARRRASKPSASAARCASTTSGAWGRRRTWRELAADAGLTGVIALPVSPDDDTAATLSLYRRSAGGWSAGDVADATAFTARLRDLIAAAVRFAADGLRPATGDLGTAGPRD
jgi:hypothetical protein